MHIQVRYAVSESFFRLSKMLCVSDCFWLLDAILDYASHGQLLPELAAEAVPSSLFPMSSQPSLYNGK